MRQGLFERRRQARRLQLSDQPRHLVRVPPGPAGRPGETVVGTSQPLTVGVLGPDGSRNDFRILLSPRSIVTAVCLGQVAETGDASASATRSRAFLRSLESVSWLADPVATELAGEPAVRSEFRLRRGAVRVVDIKFAHDGWLFVAGLHLSPRDPRSVEQRGLEVLSTWQWLPGTEESENSAYVPPRSCTTSRSAPVAAPLSAVWALIRRAELAGLVIDDVARAERRADGPGGRERHYLQLHRSGRTIGVLSELVSEQPPFALTFRQITPIYGVTTAWQLTPLGDGVVRVEVQHETPVVGGQDPVLVTRRAEHALDELLRRITTLLESGWRPDGA